MDTPATMPVKPIGLKPEGSKADRMALQAFKIEAGMVHLPREAAWLNDYLSELMGFPHTRHDDQVDSTSQFLNWWTAWRATQTVFVPWEVVIRIPRIDPFSSPEAQPFRW